MLIFFCVRRRKKNSLTNRSESSGSSNADHSPVIVKPLPDITSSYSKVPDVYPPNEDGYEVQFLNNKKLYILNFSLLKYDEDVDPNFYQQDEQAYPDVVTSQNEENNFYPSYVCMYIIHLIS